MHVLISALSIAVVLIVMDNIVSNERNHDSVSTLEIDDTRTDNTRNNGESNEKWMSVAILASLLHAKNHFDTKNTKAMTN